MKLSMLLKDSCQFDPQLDRVAGPLRLSSVKVEPGDVFIALPGITVDGRDYILQAIKQGASAVLFEQDGSTVKSAMVENTSVIGVPKLKNSIGNLAANYYGRPSAAMDVVGVTGTNGKTTVAYLLAQALDASGVKCAYSGTVGSGFLTELEESDLTTTDALSIHRKLLAAFNQGAQAAAIEVSSHGLAQGRVNGVEFNVAVFTNLSHEHLDYHGSMDEYGLAKQKLFEFESLRSAVINCDDEFSATLLEVCRNRSLKVITYSMHQAVMGDSTSGSEGSAALLAQDIQLDDRGIRMTIDVDGVGYQVDSQLLGMINVANILAVIGALMALGYTPARACALIHKLKPPVGRMEFFRGHELENQPAGAAESKFTPPERTRQDKRSGCPLVVVDYAHTPDALAKVLGSLRPLCKGRLLTVFGCGGDRDISKRAPMGRIAQSLSDLCIVTDDNPRTEPPEDIVAQILQGMESDTLVIHDRVLAMKEAIKLSRPNDIILLAGKGHERTYEIDGTTLRLSDREFVPQLLGTVAP